MKLRTLVIINGWMIFGLGVFQFIVLIGMLLNLDDPHNWMANYGLTDVRMVTKNIYIQGIASVIVVGLLAVLLIWIGLQWIRNVTTITNDLSKFMIWAKEKFKGKG